MKNVAIALALFMCVVLLTCVILSTILPDKRDATQVPCQLCYELERRFQSKTQSVEFEYVPEGTTATDNCTENGLYDNTHPLNAAIVYNDIQAIVALCRTATSVNIPDKRGNHPVELLINGWNGIDSIRIGDILVAHGLNLSVQLPGRSTLLHVAASDCDSAAITWLVENGADMDSQDDKGDTPLHIVSRHPGDTQCVDAMNALLRAGASISIRNREGQLPIGSGGTGGK